MFKKILITVLGITLLAACGSVTPTGNTSSDVAAAQNYLPNIAGYNATNASSIADALATAGGGAALTSGNPLLAGAIAKLDSMIHCYQDVGAVAAQVYTPADLSVFNDPNGVPAVGAVAVINQDRLVNNFLSCALGQNQAQAQAQTAGVQPCGGSGDFTINGEHLNYLYASTSPTLCATFDQHFQNVRQNQGS